MSFEDFVRKHSGMSPRPGYYGGRGPCRDDLNEQHLERLYQGLKTEVGDEAARNFVMMVEDLEDMSATAFLWSFMRYWDTKRWTTQKQQPNDGVTPSGHGDQMWMEAEHAVLNVLTDRRSLEDQKHQSADIKRPFLMRHGVRPMKREGRVFHDGFHTVYDDNDYYRRKGRW
jgi:hypothetical protein